MRWAVIALLASMVCGSAVAFAAGLDVSSARLTVFTNTLTSPSLDLALSPSSVVVGEAATGSSTLGGGTPNAGGTVAYAVYSDAACTTEVILSTPPGTVTVSNGTVPDSAAVSFSVAGSVYWRAAYSGDGNNQPAESGCMELVVSKLTPSLSTSATASVTLGEPIADTATLTGGFAPMSGTVTFNVYGPDNLDCHGAPAASSTISLADAGGGIFTATSSDFVPALAGGYRWVASYSGDAANNPVSGGCNDANEFSVVNPLP